MSGLDELLSQLSITMKSPAKARPFKPRSPHQTMGTGQMAWASGVMVAIAVKAGEGANVPDGRNDARPQQAAQHEAREVARAHDADIEPREVLRVGPNGSEHAQQPIAHEQDGSAQQKRCDRS